MAVMMPRETWTDERLDDLNGKVDDGFAGVDRRFAEAKAETAERFDHLEAETAVKFREVDGRFNRLETRMDRGFSELNQRFDRMQFTLIAGLVTFCVALIGSCATLVGIAVL